MTTKKRNPNDATFRNINAIKRRLLDLESRVAVIEESFANQWYLAERGGGDYPINRSYKKGKK